VVYLVCLMCATVSTGFFIAPAAQHRLLFRAHQKEHLLRRANVYAVIGNVVLIPALGGAILLIVDYLFTRTEAYFAASAVAVLLVWLWIAEPALRRDRRDHDPANSR
jgi:uncharacterized membrane protein YbhN (UPF0104 family)